ncbi:hypothetical protein Tco_1561796 [Tanacetum coccineum]
MIAFLNKSKRSEDFHQIIDFLNLSHIKYALTENPTIYTSLIQQFWETAYTSTTKNEEMKITTTIDGRDFNFSKMIFEEEPATMPHDSSQPRFQSLGSDEGSLTLNELTVLYTTLSKKVEDFQNDLKQTKLTYGAAYTKLILGVKKLEHKIDQNPFISLVQDEGTSWIQEDAKTQGRTSADTEILLEQEDPTELVEDPVVVKRVKKKLVLLRRSAEKRKDKGKAIMKDDESVQKKTKKQLEQEKLGHKEAIRLQEQINKEERQRIARDAEIAK